MKKTISILKAIFLFLLEILFQESVIYIMQKIGINYVDLSINLKITFSLVTYIIIMIIGYLLYRKDINHDLKDYKENFNKYFPLAMKMWGIGLALMFVSNIIIVFILGTAAVNEQSVQETIKIAPIYMIFATVIYAPFIEELIYRKSIREIFSNDYIYIIVSGLAFGFIHTVAGLSNISELLYIFPYGFMGASFAYTYIKTKNITVTMSMHMIHNGILMIVSILNMFIIGG